MNDMLRDWMRQAAALTREGRLHDATAALRDALQGRRGAAPDSSPSPAGPPPHGEVIDGCVFEVGEVGEVSEASEVRGGGPSPAPGADPAGLQQERFTAASHTHGALTLNYKLYEPPALAPGAPRPLLVMLHGCTQDPDDFAVGTGMNSLARAQGWHVLYPAQSQQANPQKCWNWFKHNHQQRGRGETGWIASLVQAVIARHGLDPRRVCIAGLSAGGAMAALAAAAHPEVFAAAGVHSGLAPGAAASLPEALAAMKGPGSGAADGLIAQALRQGQPGRQPAALCVPTIVFHGDRDSTVHPSNGEQVVAAALQGAGGPLRAAVEQGRSAGGRPYTRAVHTDAAGRAVAESWVVHGAGHAWSGGLRDGSYTDPLGPDASREMLRFFSQQLHRG